MRPSPTPMSPGSTPRHAEPWAGMYLQRNVLAHRRLPDIDEDRVWRNTVLRAEDYLAAIRANLG